MVNHHFSNSSFSKLIALYLVIQCVYIIDNTNRLVQYIRRGNDNDALLFKFSVFIYSNFIQILNKLL